jgi:membrane AbrB-like protein
LFRSIRISPSLSPFVLTCVAGAAGGFFFSLFELPAAWLSGAMVLVAAAGFAGMPTAFPDRLRDGLFVLLGIFMGSGVDSHILERVADWPWSMFGLAGTVTAIVAVTYAFLSRVAGWDSESAFFGSIPGALSAVLALAVDRNADIARIATSQSIRLLVLVVLLPLAISSTAPGSLEPASAANLPSPLEMVVLVGICTVAAWLAARIRIPGGWMTGAFLASAMLNASGAIQVALPQWLMIPAYVGLGSLIGVRFGATSAGLFLSLVRDSLGAVAIGLLISTMAALAGAWLLDLPFGQLLLAYAPGGLEVMTLLAFMLDLDPAFVATHQMMRFICMIFLLPLAIRLVLGRRESCSG